MSSRKDEDASGGYFSFKPRSHTPSLNGSLAPRLDMDRNQEEIATLTADANIMGNKGAARWRKVATTMPKSLWKSEADATSCDHLSTLGGACEKPFGRFLGKYKLPAWSPSSTNGSSSDCTTLHSDGSSISSTSSLWGSIKINRRHQCWRCGNCFCDDHGSHYATLVLDREDALPYFPAVVQEDAVEQAPQMPSLDPAEVQPEAIEVDMRAPVPVRTAAMALSQYLAASSPHSQASSSGSQSARAPPQQNKLRGLFQSANASLESSVAGAEDWHSPFGASPTSAASLAATPDISGANSANISAACSPQSTSSHAFPSRSAAKSRQNSGTSSLLDLRNMSPRSPSPMTSRMTQLPDGRIIVREQVCLRCHDIVEQAKSRAVQKQAKRKYEMQEFAVAMETLGGYVGFEPATGEFVADSEEALASLNDLFEEYRKEVKRSASVAVGHAPFPSRHSAASLADEEDDISEGTVARVHTPHYQPSHIHAYPARACLTVERSHSPDQHHFKTQAAPTLPRYGMGGQRLQWALAPYQ